MAKGIYKRGNVYWIRWPVTRLFLSRFGLDNFRGLTNHSVDQHLPHFFNCIQLNTLPQIIFSMLLISCFTPKLIN